MYEYIDHEGSNEDLQWMQQRSDLLRKFVEDSDEVRWDFNILQLFAPTYDATPHLGPFAEFDGRKFPDPDAFPPEATQFALTRATETGNAVLRARYLDFAFERGGARDNGDRAASAYCDASEAHLRVNQPQQAVNALGRAFMITLAVGLHEKRDDVAARLLKLARVLVKTGTDPEVRSGCRTASGALALARLGRP